MCALEGYVDNTLEWANGGPDYSNYNSRQGFELTYVGGVVLWRSDKSPLRYETLSASSTNMAQDIKWMPTGGTSGMDMSGCKLTYGGGPEITGYMKSGNTEDFGLSGENQSCFVDFGCEGGHVFFSGGN
jgi:hypothetical protein